MKKTAIILLLVLVLAFTAALYACNSDEETHILFISAEVAEDTVYKVEDVFNLSTIEITAHLSDGTERHIAYSLSADILRYDKSDIPLTSDGKFSETGTFTLYITYLLRYEVEGGIEIEVKGK